MRLIRLVNELERMFKAGIEAIVVNVTMAVVRTGSA